MAWKSEAQKRKFAELLKGKKITQSQYDEWVRATGKIKLPERVEKKKP